MCGAESNVIQFRRWELTAEDLKALRNFIGESQWEPTFTILETDDGQPVVVVEYPFDEMAFQIGPDHKTGGWVAFNLCASTAISRGRTVADCLARGFQRKVSGAN